MVSLRSNLRINMNKRMTQMMQRLVPGTGSLFCPGCSSPVAISLTLDPNSGILESLRGVVSGV